MTNLDKFKEWIANADAETIADIFIIELDNKLYTSDFRIYGGDERKEAVKREADWLKSEKDDKFWQIWEAGNEQQVD